MFLILTSARQAEDPPHHRHRRVQVRLQGGRQIHPGQLSGIDSKFGMLTTFRHAYQSRLTKLVILCQIIDNINTDRND